MTVKTLRDILSNYTDQDKVLIGSGDESGYEAEIDATSWATVVDAEVKETKLVLYLKEIK